MKAGNSRKKTLFFNYKNMTQTIKEKRQELQNYFKTFFEEKNLEYKEWELTDNNGNNHLINSDVIKEFITEGEAINTHDLETLKNKIVEIDFVNGDVNLFLRYIAQFIINNF